jgi:hypothetical protein
VIINYRIPTVVATSSVASGCLFNDKDFHSILVTIVGGVLMFALSHFLQYVASRIWKKFPHA